MLSSLQSNYHQDKHLPTTNRLNQSGLCAWKKKPTEMDAKKDAYLRVLFSKHCCSTRWHCHLRKVVIWIAARTFASDFCDTCNILSRYFCPSNQKSQEAVAVSGIFPGVPENNSREVLGKLLNFFSNREVFTIPGFCAPGKANLLRTLGPHRPEPYVQTLRAGCFLKINSYSLL